MSYSGNLDKNMNLLKNSVNFSTGKITNYNVFIQVLEFLEVYNMTLDDLRKTSIVNHFNSFRKLVNDTVLAKRLKDLVRLWCRQEDQRKNGPPLVNGDSRGAEAPTHPSELPRHPTAIQKHKNKTHTSFNHRLAATQIPSIGFKISIPLSKVRLHNHNNIATHSNHPIQRPDSNPPRHTQPTPNLSNNNSQIHPAQHIPQQQQQPTHSYSEIPPTKVPVHSESIPHPVQEVELNPPSPIGATPPRKPGKCIRKTENGIVMEDGRTYLWTNPVVIEETSLVIRPYASLFEWENHLTLRPGL